MKAVAVSQRVERAESYDEVRDSLDQNVNRFLFEAGFLPVLLPGCWQISKELLIERPLSGLLLTGGNTIGECPERDSLERELLKWAIGNSIPVMGLCRGMQIIQSFFGIEHFQVGGHVRTHHRIFFRGKERLVNSYHQFTTDQTNRDLEVLAHAEDGMIEAVRHSKWPILGIMWHPEREKTFQEEDLLLLQEHFS